LIGLAVIAGLALYIGIFWLIVRALKQRWAKALAVVIAVAIPFWDLPFGYLSFQQDCKQYGGLHVFEKVSPATAIFIDRHIGYTPDQLKRFGFKVIEYGEPGNITRYTAAKDGYIKSTDQTAISKVMVHFQPNQQLPWHVVRRDYLASNVETKSVIARYTDIRWLGMWWQVEASPIFGDGGRCYFSGDNPILALLAKGNS
jgi:hypothetical protein